MEETERLIKHRICHLEQFYSLKPKDRIESPLPNSKELSAYLSGQLSLFPKNSGYTNLQWNRSKVDFIELSIALFESNSIKSNSEHKISKKELFKILMWFFNVHISRWESSLTAAKNRKLEREGQFIKELSKAFSGYVQQNFK